MRYLILLIFLPPVLLGCLGGTFTLQKLDGMRQIRGFKAGAAVEKHVVRDKWPQPPRTYWISWTDRSIRTRGNHRLNLPQDIWDRYDVGDEIEIRFLPDRGTPFHRDGIYASDENFAFDYGLLMVEFGVLAFGVIGACGTALFLSRYRGKMEWEADD